MSKWTACVVGLLIVALAALGITSIRECQRTERAKFEHGYEQRSVAGMGFPVWVKASADSVRP